MRGDGWRIRDVSALRDLSFVLFIGAYGAVAGYAETGACAECAEDVIYICFENLQHVGHSCRILN